MRKLVAVSAFAMFCVVGAIFYFMWPSATRTVPLTIATMRGDVHLRVELALTEREQERGLMFRRQLAPDAGMFFDLHRNQRVSIWMKNTFIPLDVIFVADDGTIMGITAKARPRSLRLITAPVPVRAVLEIAGGRAEALGITIGDLVKNPPLTP